jgi:hypothetical protein
MAGERLSGHGKEFAEDLKLEPADLGIPGHIDVDLSQPGLPPGFGIDSGKIEVTKKELPEHRYAEDRYSVNFYKYYLKLLGS